MWAPIPWAIDVPPLVEERRSGVPLANTRLRLSDAARRRVCDWVDLICESPINRPILELMCGQARPLAFGLHGEKLPALECQHVYGNHDVYRGFALNAFARAPAHGWASQLLGVGSEINADRLHIEHGHRHDVANSDGSRVGWLGTATANFDPSTRRFEDLRGTASETLYDTYVPAAAIWYLIARAVVTPHPAPGASSRPPTPDPFDIFVQGHTHNPALVKVTASVRSRRQADTVAPEAPRIDAVSGALTSQ